MKWTRKKLTGMKKARGRAAAETRNGNGQTFCGLSAARKNRCWTAIALEYVMRWRWKLNGKGGMVLTAGKGDWMYNTGRKRR